MRSGAARMHKVEKTKAFPTPEASSTETREVMDIRQASAYLGISPDSLYRYASEGTIPAFRLGNRWRFRKLRLDNWMDEQSGLGTQQGAVRSGERKPVRAVR